MNILLKSLLAETKKKNKVLFDNEWLSLMSMDAKDGPYIYSHETRCNGNIVAVLPYERIGKDGWQYYLRSEVTPCWGNEAQLSSLTGGVDSGDTPIQTALKELEEEAGLVCKEGDLQSLGTCRGTKSSDTVYHLYAVDVTKVKQGEPTEKGTGDMVWLRKNDAIQRVMCPHFYVMMTRLGLN